ncbi:MAG: GTP cyclohydrolase II [Caldilineaceae bacterium]|nr:GTP cyclohydrolase II [Caldilineaceae bacterium]
MQPTPVRRTICARIPTPEGEYQLCHYVDERNQKEHLALMMGDVTGQDGVLVRVHSECFTGDVLGSQRCDCGEQLHRAMRLIAQEGAGIILYLRQEGRGIGLEQKLRAYNLQDQGYDTVDANLMLGHQADEREYSAAAAMLRDLEVRSIRLMTNNPDKIDRLTGLGIVIVNRIALEPTVTRDNAAYLATKAQRMRHLLNLPMLADGAASLDVALPSQVAGQIESLRQRAAAHFRQHRRPFVTLSYAQSLDGTVGAQEGGPLPLSGPTSLRVTHALRAAHDAILVGIGTVLADDPQLTVRLVEGSHPQPIVVDSHLRCPPQARLLAHPKGLWIAHVGAHTNGLLPAATHLQHAGARLLALPTNAEGQVDLEALLVELGRLGIQSVMVEGGARIIGSLLAHSLAHFAVLTIAPRFVDGRRIPLAGLVGPSIDLLDPAYIQAGQDVMVWSALPHPERQTLQPAPPPTGARPPA